MSAPNVVKLGDARPRQFPHGAWADYTTRGNGERVVDAHGADLHHAPAAGWLVWDGKRWAADPEDKQALRLAMDTMVEMHMESLRIDGLKVPEKKHIAASQAPSAWAAALKTASLLPPIATTFEAFDDGPRAPPGHEYRLNVANGTIDLRTGKLGPHRREDMITKIAPPRFDPAADASLWTKFLTDVQPNEEIRSFLQRLAGYWALGTVRDQVFPIFWGQGGNGKGTYLDTIALALGEYAGAVPEDVLVSSHQKPHPTGLMTFRGLRLAVASETDEGDKLAIATLKRLTGGDKIKARFMNKDFIEFEPTHKIVLMTNPRPRLGGNVNAALKRRIFFVPWDTIIPAERANTRLKEQLAAEGPLSSVLNWIVAGFQAWQRHGLAPPASVLAATSDYMQDEDAIATFLEERCEFGEKLEVSADDLYKAYKIFCKEASEPHIRQQDFKPAVLGKEIATIAGVTWKRSKHARTYHGLALRKMSSEDYERRERSLWGPS